MSHTSMAEIELREVVKRHGTYAPSPWAWEDQVLYFLMLDRFSDGAETAYRDNEGAWVNSPGTAPMSAADHDSVLTSEDAAAAWREAGGRWCGGTLAGLTCKLGYLQRLGVSAVWVSPLLKQVSFQSTYHGYGIQNYLEVDPHFGTREDLVRMVKTAHDLGIYVILDIILNHSGNVFSYQGGYKGPPWDGRVFPVMGFNDASGRPVLPFGDLGGAPSAWPGGGIWPRELQDPSVFTCKGSIRNWDFHPEYLEGDFEDLKDIDLGHGHTDSYTPSRGLELLGEVYKYWIAVADLDGFRIDTVKHMDLGASRWFASVIREFTQTIGKENFYLIGEITGGRRRAFETLEQTGIDAALGIDDIPDKLEYLVKGYRGAREYFDLFRNSILIDKSSHSWFRDKVVTVLDDHDQVRKGERKARFCAHGEASADMVAAVVGLQATSLGIPCVYYGTEQLLDGEGGNDRYIRECLFGGPFGAFRSTARHCFDEDAPAYKAIRDILSLRAKHPALRRGRQYLRELSRDRHCFYLPEVLGDRMRSIVAWSRILSEQEILLALNTSDTTERVYAIVDARLNASLEAYTCLYSTDEAQTGTRAALSRTQSSAVVAEITVPPHGFTIWGARGA